MGLCKLIVIVGVAAIWMQSSNAASIGGQDNLCMCTREYFPICGSDGVTYSNKCVFECEKRTSKDLEIASFGDCADQQAADEVLCMCTREYEPVCGTDGKTYSNKCTFNCAQKNNKALEFSSFGACVELSNLPMDEEIPEIRNLPMDGDMPEIENYGLPCICTREYMPVCGSDGKTYSNKCNFKCAQKDNKALEFSSFGECVETPEVQNFEVSCLCTREYNPVCGNNGQTYSNKCMLNCAKNTNKNLEMLASGECVEVPPVQTLPMDEETNEISNLPLVDGMCMCTYEYAPVCGTDGKTYANKCSFNCARKTNTQLELFAIGACDQIRNFPVIENENIQVQNLPLNEELCICTREYMPVCGSDGRTYSNKCLMNCEQHMKSDLKLEHYGEC